jgi:hypothetical protein
MVAITFGFDRWFYPIHVRLLHCNECLAFAKLPVITFKLCQLNRKLIKQPFGVNPFKKCDPYRLNRLA